MKWLNNLQKRIDNGANKFADVIAAGCGKIGEFFRKHVVESKLKPQMILLLAAVVFYLSSQAWAQSWIYGTVLGCAIAFFLLSLPSVKEAIRRTFVSLKRKPQTIALLGLVVAFVYYSMNLTKISNTTAGFQTSGMGLSEFVMMLFSLLAIVCCLNSFPHRKKANIPMLVLTFVMLGTVLFCNVYYDRCIDQALEFRWNEKYTKHISDAEKAILDAREDDAEAAANAAEAALLAEQVQADADAVAAIAAKVDEIVTLVGQTPAVDDVAEEGVPVMEGDVPAEGEAPAEGEEPAAEEEGAPAPADVLLKAAEDVAAALTEATEAAESAATASGNIATNAEATAKAAAEAEKGTSLSDIKAGGKDADAAMKKTRNLLKNVNKAAEKAATARATAEEALASALAAAEALGVDVSAYAANEPAEGEIPADSENAAEGEAAAEAEEPAPIELDIEIYKAAKGLGDEEVAKTLAKDPSIEAAAKVMEVHRIILIAAVALIVLLPVYKPLLRRIRTSVEVEATGDMGKIELDGSDD